LGNPGKDRHMPIVAAFVGNPIVDRSIGDIIVDLMDRQGIQLAPNKYGIAWRFALIDRGETCPIQRYDIVRFRVSAQKTAHMFRSFDFTTGNFRMCVKPVPQADQVIYIDVQRKVLFSR
jgi:hypothetical protein